MFLSLPIGVEEATVDRVPWVSIAIAALCALAFAVTWVAPRYPDGVDEEAFAQAVDYWKAHPYLEFPASFAQRHLDPRARPYIAEQRREALANERELPAPEVRARQQAALEGMTEAVSAGFETSPLRRFSLVPHRGLAQPGWLTHMFLHLGWLHLLGNMLFFYLVGPLLEDVWGRPLFSGFYLAGGLFAALAHFLLDRSSEAMMAGASGAIAACMGAFTLRYAARKIRMAYVLWFIRIKFGTFLMPAWLWGLFWFGSELWDFYRNGGSGGVAVMAHLGGFAFGLVLATGLKATGLEARYVAPLLQKKTGEWSQHPALAEAASALEQGDRDAARRAYARALAEQPDSRDAQVGLARLELDAGRTAEGMARAQRLFERELSQNEAHLWALVEELGPNVDPARLRPAFAYRLASALERGLDGARHRALPFYLAARAAPGALGAKALLRAAQLRLEALDRPEAELALGHLREALALPEVPPEVMAQVRELEASVAARVAARPVGATEALEAAAQGAFHQARVQKAPRVVACRVLGLTASALSVQPPSGNPRQVELARVLAVGVGLAPGPARAGAAPSRLLLTDLVLDWGNEARGPTVLRIPSSALGLHATYPGVPPREAYARFLGHLLQQSGGRALPDAAAVARGEYESFPDEQAMTDALYAAC